jgi:hypothetical protein
VPVMLNVCPVCGLATKLSPVMFAEVTIAARVVGLNENPVLLGVTAYVPADKPLKLYAPDVFVVVVAVAAPLSVTVAELPPAAGLTVPDIEKVCPPGV